MDFAFNEDQLELKRQARAWLAERYPLDREWDAAQDDPAPVTVTARERELIQLVAEGQSNKEAASTLGISVKTIEAHRANIMRKLHLRSVSDLVRYAIRNKIVQP